MHFHQLLEVYALGTRKSKQDDTYTGPLIDKVVTYIGDLLRYLQGHGSFDPLLARRFYLTAATLNPENGLPFNQLASLSGNVNHGLDSVLYYLKWYVLKIFLISLSFQYKGFFSIIQPSFAAILCRRRG